jgi:hypothetical protein
MSRFALVTCASTVLAAPAAAQFQHPSPLPDVMLVNDAFGKSNPNLSSNDLFEDQILRLADFDGDGTYLGLLETSLLFEFGTSPNKNKSWQIQRVRSRLENGVPAVYFTNGRNGNVGASNNFVAHLYRGVDLDGNAFIDPAELTLVMNLETVLGGTQGMEDVALAKNGGLWSTTDFPGGGLVYQNGGAPIATVDFNTLATFKVPGKNGVLTNIDTDDFTTCTPYGDNGVLVYSDGFGTSKDEAIHAFFDLNGDGDAKDPGEATCFLNASGANVGLEKNPDFGTTLRSITVSSTEKLYGWLKEMATMDEGKQESYFFACNSSNTSTFGVNENAEYINGLIFRAVDKNSDRDVNDSGEVNLYYDGSGASGLANELPKILGIDVYQNSLIVFVLRGGSKIVIVLTDLNGDGDAMDDGERLDPWDEVNAGLLPFNLFLFGTAAGALEPGILPEPTSRQATYLGTGCSQFGGPVPKIFAQGKFQSGSNFFDVRLSDAAPNALAYYFLGLGPTFFGQQLPLDIGFLGYPGCTLYTDLGFSWPVFADAAGEATLPFGGKLPASGLSGIAFRTQWVTVDFSGPTTELGMSRQMTLTAP